MMDFTPTPRVLLGQHNANLTWPTIVKELIDNALDARAHRVAVTFQSAGLTVEDDGDGCGDIEAMLRLGEHKRGPGTKLGRYGVGLKHAACWLWGCMKIDTAWRDMRRHVTIDWTRLVKQATWTAPDPATRPANGFCGTRLVFSKIVRGTPRDYQRLIDDIAYTFTPALQSGRQIILTFPRKKVVAASPMQLPPLDDVLEDAFTIDGRGVRLHVGIIKEGTEYSHPGFAYCHYHRIIYTGTRGAGQYPSGRVAGQVWLDDKWPLTVHKDDISEYGDDLFEAVLARCEPLLRKAQEQAVSLSSEAFNNTVNQKLRQALAKIAKKKEKRKPPQNATGAVKPKNTGRERKRARKQQPGDRLLSEEKINSLTIQWKPIDSETVGEVDEPGSTIWLNSSNVYLAELRRAENAAAILLVAVGMYVYIALHSDKDPQRCFPGWREMPPDPQYFPTWAQIVSTIDA